MAEIPLSFTDIARVYADLPPAVVKNRIFEQTPTQARQAAFMARPGSVTLGAYGTGPIRGTYSLPGLHNGALFFVSGNAMFRRDPDGTTIAISGSVFGTGAVSFTGVEGPGYEYLFISDGSHLQVYTGGSNADGTLTGTGHVADGDMIQIGETWYRWTDTVSDGSGTMADPWKVLRGADLEEDLESMVNAISFIGTPGTDFSANMGGQNADVTAALVGTTVVTQMTVTARIDTSTGNLIATTVDSSDTVPAVSWGAATLTSGGSHGLSGVEVPDGSPPGSLATLKGHVVVTIDNSDRFYWIRPGETSIDALNFATAESRPDNIIAAVVVSDTLWLVGNGSSEVWYATADPNTPFAPVSGRVYDRGAVDGTVVDVKGTVYLVGPDYVVYAISGGPQRVSNHGVEELIRLTLGDEG